MAGGDVRSGRGSCQISQTAELSETFGECLDRSSPQSSASWAKAGRERGVCVRERERSLNQHSNNFQEFQTSDCEPQLQKEKYVQTFAANAFH